MTDDRETPWTTIQGWMDAAGVKDATITELRAENERLWRAVRAYRVNSIHESIDSMQELDEALDALAPIQEKP